MHYRRSDRSVDHRTFSDLPRLLRRGDLLVFNNARVLPARFVLRKISGGRVEGLFLEELGVGRWRVLLRNLGSYRGDELLFERDPDLACRVLSTGDGGECEIDVFSVEPATILLSRIGRAPLPPYIRRDKVRDPRDDLDRERYQTVFANAGAAVAAPTAALHFSESLLGELRDTGVTLNVGLGTFKPVTVERLEDHVMHAEGYTIDAAAADALNRAKSEGRRIVAVGTTSARVLQSQPQGERFIPKTAETRIFIRPPYAWKLVDGLITNFHLPRSTLIALVAAMVSLEEQRRLYRLAIERRYRFFSYGDAMLIE